MQDKRKISPQDNLCEGIGERPGLPLPTDYTTTRNKKHGKREK